MLRSYYSIIMIIPITLSNIASSAVTTNKHQNCLARCEFEIRDTHRLFVYAEDILSFQRFFEPSLVGDALQDVTSLKITCSKALLDETITPFQPVWDSVVHRVLKLHIQGCRILSLAEGALQEFQSLTSLIIDNQNEGSPFMPTEGGGLQGLRNMASFTLTRVKLSNIRVRLFHDDTRHNLMKVYLNHNALTSLNTLTFCDMPRLSDLDLSYNKLTTNKLTFLSCIKSLYALNMSHNAIITLKSDSFLRNRMLHTLDLSHNNMLSVQSLVTLINETRSLRILFIAYNPLECNVSSLTLLHSLADKSGVKITDWQELRCLQQGQWIYVNDLIFPYSIGRILRAWYVVLAMVIGVLMCLCCLLALVCHTDNHNTVPVCSSWHWVQVYLRRHLTDRERRPQVPSRFPHTTTCSSLLQRSEDEQLPSPDAKDSEMLKKLRIEEDAEEEEFYTDNIPYKLVGDIGEGRPFLDKGTDYKDIVDNELPSQGDDPKRISDGSYVSYKTRLDPDSLREGEYNNKHRRLSDASSVTSSNAATSDAKEIYGTQNIEASTVLKEEIRVITKNKSQDDESHYCATTMEEDTSLTTSAGVATTPTETHTVAVAGLRGITQYTLASWLTVKPPQLDHHSQSTNTTEQMKPTQRSPTPMQLLTAKMQQQNSSTSFGLDVPLRASGSRDNQQQRGEQETINGRIHHDSQRSQQKPTQHGSLHRQLSNMQDDESVPQHEQVSPAGSETQMPSNSLPKQGMPLPNVANECLVCQCCLEALSLPNIQSPQLLQQDANLYPTVTINDLTAARRRQRLMHSASAEGDCRVNFPERSSSTYKRKTRNGVSNKPISRSLDRGTRRKTIDPVSNYSFSQKHELVKTKVFMKNKSLRQEMRAHLTDPKQLKISDHRLTTSPKVTTDNHETFPKRSKVDRPLIANTEMGEPSRVLSNDATSSITETASLAKPSSAQEQCIHALSESKPSNEDCTCKCDVHQHPIPTTTATAGESSYSSEGEHCDIDIEAQASQIIDMVELHAQNPCNPS